MTNSKKSKSVLVIVAARCFASSSESVEQFSHAHGTKKENRALIAINAKSISCDQVFTIQRIKFIFYGNMEQRL